MRTISKSDLIAVRSALRNRLQVLRAEAGIWDVGYRSSVDRYCRSPFQCSSSFHRYFPLDCDFDASDYVVTRGGPSQKCLLKSLSARSIILSSPLPRCCAIRGFLVFPKVRKVTKANDNPTSPLLTMREASIFLHVHSNTLRRWNNSGLIGAYRLGPRGARRFRRDELQAFLDEKYR